MKTNKPTLFLLILVTFSSFSTFGQKCKFDKDKKDEFTNEHVRSSKLRIKDFFWYLTIEQKGSKYFLTPSATKMTKEDDIIPLGAKILFKLENGKIIELIVSEDCAPIHSVSSPPSTPAILSTWLPKGELSKENMTLLSESPLVMIRMNIAGKDFDSPGLSDKAASKIQQAAACFLSE